MPSEYSLGSVVYILMQLYRGRIMVNLKACVFVFRLYFFDASANLPQLIVFLMDISKV